MTSPANPQNREYKPQNPLHPLTCKSAKSRIQTAKSSPSPHLQIRKIVHTFGVFDECILHEFALLAQLQTVLVAERSVLLVVGADEPFGGNFRGFFFQEILEIDNLLGIGLLDIEIFRSNIPFKYSFQIFLRLCSSYSNQYASYQYSPHHQSSL
jgi:hypothetical protein